MCYKTAFEVLGERERDFSRFIWHVNTPLATQERKSKVFSQPKSRKIQGDLTIISTSELRAENFEWVVLPLFFLTLFGSHRYTIPAWPAPLIIRERHHEYYHHSTYHCPPLQRHTYVYFYIS